MTDEDFFTTVFRTVRTYILKYRVDAAGADDVYITYTFIGHLQHSSHMPTQQTIDIDARRMADFIYDFWCEHDQLPDFSMIGQVFDQTPIWAKTRVVDLVARKYLQWNPNFNPPYEMYDINGEGMLDGGHLGYNPQTHWRTMSVDDYLAFFPGIDRQDTDNRMHHCLACGRRVPVEERTPIYYARWYKIGPYCEPCPGRTV